jgi:hypothetical protein
MRKQTPWRLNRFNKDSRLTLFLLICILILLIPFPLFGQTGTATLRGTVLDSQNLPVAGAIVKISNPGKNFSRETTSTETGSYVFTALPPGAFILEAEFHGFKKTIISKVQAQVDTSTTLDIHLEIGEVSQTVTVTSESAAPINTVDATMGVPFENRRITEMPLNARNIVNLLSLQPGVTPEGEVNGGRRDQSNITLDGVDVNEEQGGLDPVARAMNINDSNVSGNQTFVAFSSVLRVTPDSVQEFRVTTSNPNPDQGRSSGAQVSMVTKSGTNQFHGSLYEFHRNTVTTANDWFNNQAGRFGPEDPEVISGEKSAGDLKLPRPKLIRNIFGGSLGGPLLKNRAFFFYNFEGRRDASETAVSVRPVPTATLREGIVQYQNVDGGITTLSPSDIATAYPETGGVNQSILKLLKTAPLPNDSSTGDGLNVAGYRFNASTPVHMGTHIAKLDFNLTNRQTLFVRGNYQNDKYTQAPQFPTTPAPDIWVHPTGFVAGHNWTITPSLLNNVRFGLTRQAMSMQGDIAQNLVTIRSVFQPYLYQRAVNRVTPVYNLTDDLSWVKKQHTFQFGTNIRSIRNNREAYSGSFDTADINYYYFEGSGVSLTDPLADLASGSQVDTSAAIAAVLGRYSQYASNIIYDKAGDIQPIGTPSQRTFATQEYEFYGQDSWKLKPNLTLSYGLRWGVSRPVYEANGYQVQPTVSLGDYFERRVAGAEAGIPYIEPITIDLSGPANGRQGFYKMEWNKFAPSVGVAWSPDFGDNLVGRIFGRNGRSVIRGGYRMIYDRIGSQLAVSFDLNNTLGFSSTSEIGPNTYNVTDHLGPAYTGLNPDVRSFPNLEEPVPLKFPLSKPSDGVRRIESTLDDTITTPVHHTWNVSYAREFSKGLSMEISYIGSVGRNLLVTRDIMHLNNLKDPKSGQTWYQAAGVLADLRDKDVPFNSPNVPKIPFFENLYPGDSLVNAINGYFGFDPSGDWAGLSPSQMAYAIAARDYFDIADWTYYQDVIDDYSPVVGSNAFFHPQYGALGVYSTIGQSWYNGANISVRQRLGNDLTFDFNYTYSKSFDYTSQLLGAYTFTFDNALIRNPLNPRQARAVSDYDMPHNFNANFLIGLPFGKGKKFLSNAPKVVDFLLGGWQLAGVFRLHSGTPFVVQDAGRWATNWNVTSYGVRRNPVTAETNTGYLGQPNAFQDPVAVYQSYRNPRAGEDGDRNTLRYPRYVCLDSALSKTFNMPYSEKHQLQFRAEVFNVTNTQPFGLLDNTSLGQDPWRGEPSSGFGRYVGSQTPTGESRPGRVMQFALRYVF